MRPFTPSFFQKLFVLPLVFSAGSPMSHAEDAEIVARGTPSGAITLAMPAGRTGISFPLVAREVAAGEITGNTSHNVSFSGAVTLSADERYYIEVVSGAFEGERLEIDVAATASAPAGALVIDRSTRAQGTLANVVPGVLAGARAVIRPFVTLGQLGAQFEPALLGDNNWHRADGVWFYDGRDFVFFYLDRHHTGWRAHGRANAYAQGVPLERIAIPPDISVLVELRSGAKRWTHSGVVRTNAFRKNLVADTQGFATGFPVEMSPAQTGAFVDMNAPVATRWTGSNNIQVADSLQIHDGATDTFSAYYLKADGVSWQSASGGPNMAFEEILPASGMILLRRKQSDPEYLILRPFAL